MATNCDKCGGKPKPFGISDLLLGFDYCEDCMIKLKKYCAEWNKT